MPLQLGCLAEYHSLHLDVVGWQEPQDGGDKRWVRLTGFGGAEDIWTEMRDYNMTQLCRPCRADHKPVPINAVEGLLRPHALGSSTQAT